MWMSRPNTLLTVRAVTALSLKAFDDWLDLGQIDLYLFMCGAVLKFSATVGAGFEGHPDSLFNLLLEWGGTIAEPAFSSATAWGFGVGLRLAS